MVMVCPTLRMRFPLIPMKPLTRTEMELVTIRISSRMMRQNGPTLMVMEWEIIRTRIAMVMVLPMPMITTRMTPPPGRIQEVMVETTVVEPAEMSLSTRCV